MIVLYDRKSEVARLNGHHLRAGHKTETVGIFNLPFLYISPILLVYNTPILKAKE